MITMLILFGVIEKVVCLLIISTNANPEGKAKTFENNGVVKYFDKGKSFYKTNVYKTGITLEEIQHIKSLRQSIQAWVYARTQPLTNGAYVDTLTPILIDNDSFSEYNTKDSFYEIELSFSYANVVKSQSQ